MSKKVVFMGSPDFSIPTLECLNQRNDLAITAVFTQPPKEKGRGKKVSPTPIHKTAERLNIPVLTPLTKQEIENEVLKLEPDLIIVIAYGLILPKSVTDRYFCINLHASILPQYRGASPIHQSLLNGIKRQASPQFV